MERTWRDGVTSLAAIFACVCFTLNSEWQNTHKQNSTARVHTDAQFSVLTLLLVSAQAGLIELTFHFVERLIMASVSAVALAEAIIPIVPAFCPLEDLHAVKVENK